MLFKNLLVGVGSAGIIGAGGYGIYSATSSGDENKKEVAGSTVSMNENAENTLQTLTGSKGTVDGGDVGKGEETESDQRQRERDASGTTGNDSASTQTPSPKNSAPQSGTSPESNVPTGK